MHEYAKCNYMFVYALNALYILICRYCNEINMQKYANKKYAQIFNKYAQNMQKYAAPHDYASYLKICKIMPKIYLCKYMQANMIFVCKICTPYFADGSQAEHCLFKVWAEYHMPMCAVLLP